MPETDITTSSDDLFERNPLIKLFGDSGALRILAVFINAGNVPLTVSDLANQADVSTQTVYNNIDSLIDYGFVEEADQVGNATRYTAVLDSDQMQGLMRVLDSMIDADSDT